MTRPEPSEGVADWLAQVIQQHWENRDVEKARKVAAEAMREQPMTPKLRKAVELALGKPDWGRGRPPRRDQDTIGRLFEVFRGQGLSEAETIEAIQSLPGVTITARHIRRLRAKWNKANPSEHGRRNSLHDEREFAKEMRRLYPS